jgi:hypothetical protein
MQSLTLVNATTHALFVSIKDGDISRRTRQTPMFITMEAHMASNEEMTNEKVSKIDALLQTAKKIILKVFNKIDPEKASSGFDKMENKMTFPAARLFLHFFAICGVLGVIGGICVILYSFTPTIPENVQKPKLIERTDMTFEEYQNYITNSKAAKKKKSQAATFQQANEYNQENKNSPNISFDKIQEVLPDIKFFEKGKRINTCDKSEGHYEYGDWGDFIYPSRCYQTGTVDTKITRIYRALLNQTFPNDSLQQQKALDKIALHLTNYQPTSRKDILGASLEWLKFDDSELFNLWESIDKALGNAALAQSTLNPEKIFKAMFSFVSKKEGSEYSERVNVLKKSLPLIQQAGGDEKYSVFYTIGLFYANNGYEEWDLATKNFLSLKQLQTQDSLAQNLSNFYTVINLRDEKRVDDNKKMQEEYEINVSNAKKRDEERITQKAGMSMIGLYIIGGGFATITIFAIILLFFSMQRIFSRMECAFKSMENMIKTNKA